VAPSPEAAAPTPPPVSESERALLLDLRQRREELDARAQENAAREALLAATERRIGQRVDELKALQSRLEALESNRRERDETSWRGLVKVYETMKPRDAATIMNDLDQAVLLGVLDRMKESKVAPILAAMQPDRARLITAELAQHRQRANTPPRAGTPATSN
jgi:flagellar motility protein MotE (MotC chaperone)